MKLKDWIRKVIERNLESYVFRSRLTRTLFDDGLNEWLVKVGIFEDGEIVLNDSGFATHRDDSFCCERCGGTFHVGEQTTVATRLTALRRRIHEEWCERCSNNHAFSCSSSGDIFADGSFDAVDVEGETVCLQMCEDDLHCWDDGSYHWESEPERQEDEVPEYHACTRKWKSKVFNGFDVLGVELEVEMESREACVEMVEICDRLGIIVERDGSLDDDKGIEIVGPPIKFADYPKSEWKQVFDALKSRSAAGWDAGTGYGMHVNVNRLYDKENGASMTPLHNAKFCQFINSNKALCEQIAGRKENSWSRYCPKNNLSFGRFDTDKYEAAANRDYRRIEVRIFRSTLKWESFLKNVEFVMSVLRYTKECGNNDLHAALYNDWLVKRKKEYANLCKWMKERNVTIPPFQRSLPIVTEVKTTNPTIQFSEVDTAW